MSDVKCPYCGAEQEICHDDGYGLEEYDLYEQECGECEKVFAYTTGILLIHQARRADCLNGSPHNYKPTATWPKEYTKMRCSDCGDERDISDDEMAELLSA